MLTPLNTIFLRETVKEMYLERRRGGKGEEERQTRNTVRKTFVFSRFQLVWCNSPTGRRVGFSVPPSRTSKKNLISTVHTVEALESNTGKPVSMFPFQSDTILF